MIKVDHANRDVHTIEMRSLADVIERYQLSGPHATIVIDLATPGHVGDDRSVRWHARRHELVHAGADAEALAHLDRLVEALEPRPATVLLTANTDGSAHCWLSDHSVTRTAQVGDSPALLPAIDELTDRSPVLAALIDHLGADLFCVDRSVVGEVGTVKGDHVQTHRHVGGDQAGHQRRADGVYERNAEAIAAEIARQAVAGGARLIVLSGDTREVTAVEQHLESHHLDSHHLSVRTVHAGARHESRALERLRTAVAEQELAERERRRATAVSEFERAVGQHTLAVTGRESTTTAIHEGRLATLLVERTATAADDVARDTLRFGGQVAVVDHVDDPDGIAGMLRYATHQER